MLSGPNSFSMTAIFWPWFSVRMRLSSVVLPAPRKPVSMVTGTILSKPDAIVMLAFAACELQGGAQLATTPGNSIPRKKSYNVRLQHSRPGRANLGPKRLLAGENPCNTGPCGCGSVPVAVPVNGFAVGMGLGVAGVAQGAQLGFVVGQDEAGGGDFAGQRAA